MFTKKKNGKRYCSKYHNIPIHAWDYIKEILKESGFRVIQKAVSSEYIMKGCEDKIIVYVKFHNLEDKTSTLIFLNDQEKSEQLNLEWSKEKDFADNGDKILDMIRHLWDY